MIIEDYSDPHSARARQKYCMTIFNMVCNALCHNHNSNHNKCTIVFWQAKLPFATLSKIENYIELNVTKRKETKQQNNKYIKRKERTKGKKKTEHYTIWSVRRNEWNPAFGGKLEDNNKRQTSSSSSTCDADAKTDSNVDTETEGNGRERKNAAVKREKQQFELNAVKQTKNTWNETKRKISLVTETNKGRQNWRRKGKRQKKKKKKT